MKIKLEGGYIITSDSMNYVLSKYTISEDKDGNEVMRLSGTIYPTTIEQALKTYKERYIRASNCTTIPQILEVVKDIDKKIEKVLEGI